MSSNDRCVLARAPVIKVSREILVERRLQRFHPRFQEAIRTLAVRHESLADLAVSFPALLFALAYPRAKSDSGHIVKAVIEGEKLDNLARVSGIPIWLRKLAPEAFVKPIAALPDGLAFRRQVANYIPRSTKIAPIWLQAVADAHSWGHDDLSIWIAREVSCRRAIKLGGLKLVSVWAWLSTNGPETSVLPYAPSWKGSMRYETALRWAQAWRLALELHMCLGDEPIQDVWLSSGQTNGYDFVPLRSKQDILDEASHMKNCLRTYGVRVARNRCKLWSVRKDGERIATLEIACRNPDPCPRVVQIRTINDGQASPEIWWAAHKWVRSHNLADINTTALSWREAPIDRTRWITFWRPYWLAKRQIPNWLPLSPSLSALNEL